MLQNKPLADEEYQKGIEMLDIVAAHNEELMKTDETLPRNPVLAKFFRLAKLCESAGYGFDKMLQWKKQTGNEVLFETSIDKTKFTFMLDTTKAIREENFTENNQKTTQKIIDLIKENPNITQIEIAEFLGITRDGVAWQLKKMTTNGIIRREGADKGGKWVIIKTD